MFLSLFNRSPSYSSVVQQNLINPTQTHYTLLQSQQPNMKYPCVAVHNQQHYSQHSQFPRPEVTQQAQIMNNTTTLPDTTAVMSSATHVFNNDYDQSQLLSGQWRS